MMPSHCKDVTRKEVDFALSREEIISRLKGRKIYKSTKYLVLENGGDFAVVEVSVDPTPEDKLLFKPIKEVKVISLPENTLFIENEKVNVLNANSMAAAAEKDLAKTVIVEGEHHHISFITPTEKMVLKVVEAVPPFPPRLFTLVKKAVENEQFSGPIEVVPDFTDLRDLAGSAGEDSILFPCKGSALSLKEEKQVYFLDRAPTLPEKITLIGCRLSKRIFEEIYGHAPMGNIHHQVLRGQGGIRDAR